ncbi:MAG: hypothetical protein LR015_04970, partial [Verrucomicrobia bacterium]|nr:hypothetical protein [Verrucomicrobiota bacterium]
MPFSPMSIPYTQDSRAGSPSLHFYLNEDNLSDLPTTSRGCTKNLAECVPTLLKDGFCGIQLTTSKPEAAAPLNHCALDRINTAAEAENVIARHACLDHTCLTVHAGWGLEDDDAVDRLVEAILNASVKHRLPVYVETHRATITQDIWRTVRL